LAWAPDTTIWTKPLAVKGFGGAYASMLKLGSRVMMYSNLSLAARSKPCPGASCPGIVLYTGNSTTNVTQSALVAPNSMINDVFGPDGVKLAPQRMFTRVSVVRSERNGTFYAIAHVADTYPPGPSGVYPALLTSPNGTSWTYHGKIKGEPWDLYGPGSGRAWANSMAFIVNDEAAGALDTANPLANRFVLYSDGYGDLSSLSLLYSADGTTWYFARTTSGAIRDLRPTELMGEQPIFASAVKTPHGYHMITSKDWPVTAQRHLFSCDGLSWALLGKPSSKGPPTSSPVARTPTSPTIRRPAGFWRWRAITRAATTPRSWRASCPRQFPALEPGARGDGIGQAGAHPAPAPAGAAQPAPAMYSRMASASPWISSSRFLTTSPMLMMPVSNPSWSTTGI
jgi:hypothetical protein